MIVTINGTDRTSAIADITITDNINSQVDTVDFILEKTPLDTFVPSLNDEIIITRGTDRLFAGNITAMRDSLSGANTLLYNITAIDYTFQLNRKLVVERYTNQTITYIVNDLISKYAPTFTTTHVFAAVTVNSIAFNRINLAECFRKLSELVNYNWYVDYFKDVHFFASDGEHAPFDFVDGNYIRESLSIDRNISQLKTRVIVQGGEVTSPNRTVNAAGNGTTATFPTQYKFATLPTVAVAGVAQTVGVDFLDDDTLFQCMWDFNQKVIRFTVGNIPPVPSVGTTNIDITGTPLLPLAVNIPNATAIATYGEFEFSITDKNIKTQDQAIDRALAELQAFSSALAEGSVETYKAGLRAGQIIRVVDSLRGLDEDFVIQKTQFKYLSTSATYDGVWTITLATLKMVGIISVLQKLLLNEDLSVDEQLSLLTVLDFSDSFGTSDTMVSITAQTGPYTYGTAVCGFCTCQ